jgi:hypothetical protein
LAGRIVEEIWTACRNESGHLEARWLSHVHTHTTLLTENKEDIKVVQELLRHANSRITLDLYPQANTGENRLAQSTSPI